MAHPRRRPAAAGAFRSPVRRHLWQVLHDDGTQGSGGDLARRTRLSAVVVEHELEAMCAAGIVLCERVGSRLIYRARR